MTNIHESLNDVLKLFILFVTCLFHTGLDWGGPRREWFDTLCTYLFDPNMSGLFKRLSDDSQGLVSNVLVIFKSVNVHTKNLSLMVLLENRS